MTATSKPPAKETKTETVLTRTFHAPRALVFQAWTDPKHLAKWWGPRGFTNPVCEFDPRPGGAIRIHMTAPDGTVFPMTGIVHEVKEPEWLVFTSRAFEDETGNSKLEVLNTITFTELDGKTTLTVRAVVQRAAPELSGAIAGMTEGWAQSLDKLGESLSPSATNTSDREIVVTRLFDAPRALVFDCFTDTKHLVKWWGPNGFTTTTHEMDMRPGGVWRFTMHGPDGRDYKNRVVYTTVDRPNCLGYRHVGEEADEGVSFFTTITFTEREGKTEVTLRLAFPSAAERDEVATKYGAIEGAHQTLARLGEHLATATHPAEEFVITRTFDAPRDLVFKAWTEADRLAKWWGPKGFTLLACKLDLRPGGVFFYGGKAPQGGEMWGKWVFREVAAPERLVFVVSFADEKGNTIRAPFSADWPLEVLSTVTFTEHAGKTTLTMRGIPINATEAERAAFVGMRDSMTDGWTGTFDQLAAFLAEA